MKRILSMMLRFAVLGALSVAQIAVARDRPDFSGTWSEVTVSRDEEAVRAADSHRLTIEQDSATISIRETFGSPLEWDYAFRWDGGQSTNERRTAAGDVWTETSLAHWVEGALVVNTTHRTPNGSFETLEMYYLDVHGRLNVASLGSDIRDDRLMKINVVTYARRDRS